MADQARAERCPRCGSPDPVVIEGAPDPDVARKCPDLFHNPDPAPIETDSELIEAQPATENQSAPTPTEGLTAEKLRWYFDCVSRGDSPEAVTKIVWREVEAEKARREEAERKLEELRCAGMLDAEEADEAVGAAEARAEEAERQRDSWREGCAQIIEAWADFAEGKIGNAALASRLTAIRNRLDAKERE